MKRIESQTSKEKKTKRNQILIGIFLIVIMTLSTLGYSLMDKTSNQETQTYKNLQFQKTNNQWTTIIDNHGFSFMFLPQELTDIKINITKTIDSYKNQALYLINADEAAYEIISNLEPFILRYQKACIDANDCAEDLPIKNCSKDNIIIFEKSGETSVYEQENCIFLKNQTIKAADKFLYKILKID